MREGMIRLAIGLVIIALLATAYAIIPRFYDVTMTALLVFLVLYVVGLFAYEIGSFVRLFTKRD